MNLADLVAHPGAWLGAPEEGIVISSRVRLARNIKGRAFPAWAGEAECEKIWTELREILERAPVLGKPLSAGMEQLAPLDKLVLFERHLISREHLDKGKGSGLVVSPDEHIAVMVNEEDHLRLQAIRPGLDIEEAWRGVNTLDDQIEAEIAYSFSPQLGYLTACPSNVGTGMRASVMLHVPGLVLMDEMGPIIKGMGKIGLAVRGLWGEGTEAAGNMFQVSNQITLGEKEEEIIANLKQIVLELLEHEKNARMRLLESQENKLRNHVGRALGILGHAYILTSKEALDLLSGLRLGLDLGILKKPDHQAIDELVMLTQPGHLQKIVGRKLKPDERDAERAALVREKFKLDRVKTRTRKSGRA